MNPVIAVELVALTDKLRAGLDDAIGLIKSFASDVRESMNRIANEVKQSFNLGTTVQQFQALAYAAAQTNTPLAQVQTAMLRLEQNIGLATLGSVKLQNAFRAIGLGSQELAHMEGFDRIKAIAAALNNVANQAQRAALAQQFFGRQGAQMLAFLGGIGKTDEFSNITRPISQRDAGGIEQMYQALQKVKTIWENIENVVTAHVAPVIANIVDYLIEIGVNGKSIGAYIDSAFQTVQDNLPTLLAYAIILRDAFGSIWKQFAMGATASFNYISEQFRKMIPDDLFGMSAMFKKITGMDVDFTKGAFKGLQLYVADAFKDVSAAAFTPFSVALRQAKAIIGSLFKVKPLDQQGGTDGPLLPPTNLIPLGFAERLDLFGGNAALNAQQIQRAQQLVARQPVSDEETHNLLSQVVDKDFAAVAGP